MLKPKFLLTKKIPLTIYRTSAQGTYVDGEWVAPVATTITREVNIQPLKDEELLLLPEADRAREWYKLYCAEDFIADKPGASGTVADEFIHKGDRYKVMKVKAYDDMGILNHYRAMAARLEVSAG